MSPLIAPPAAPKAARAAGLALSIAGLMLLSACLPGSGSKTIVGKTYKNCGQYEYLHFGPNNTVKAIADGTEGEGGYEIQEGGDKVIVGKYLFFETMGIVDGDTLIVEVVEPVFGRAPNRSEVTCKPA